MKVYILTEEYSDYEGSFQVLGVFADREKARTAMRAAAEEKSTSKPGKPYTLEPYSDDQWDVSDYIYEVTEWPVTC